MSQHISITERIARISEKVRGREEIKLGPCLIEDEVAGFESQNEIRLPEQYRQFLLNIGNGAAGPPHYGLDKLYKLSRYRTIEPQRSDRKRPNARHPFPFTKTWIWESGDLSSEGSIEQAHHGTLCVGTDGCGQDWSLVVTGSERGNIWLICDVGIVPTEPRLDFLAWFEGWLDEPHIDLMKLIAKA